MSIPNRTEKTLLVVQLAAAAAMLLRIGGYGEGWLPSPLASLSLLVLLLAESALRKQAAQEGRSELTNRLIAWARERRFQLGLAAIVVFALAIRL